MKCIAIVVMLAYAAHASGSHSYSAAPQVVEVRAIPAPQSYSAPQAWSAPAALQVVEVRAIPAPAPQVYSAAQEWSAPAQAYSAPSKVIEVKSFQQQAPSYDAYAQGRSAGHSSGQVVEVRVVPEVVRSAPSHEAWSAPVARSAPVHYAKAAPASAKYTAVNRGSLHEASLPGYAVDQTSVNLEAAPGTW